MSDPALANLLGAVALGLANGFDGRSGSSVDAALTCLAREGELTSRELAETLGLSQSATVRLIDRLEGAGLVARHGTAGSREVTVAVLPGGRRRAEQVRRQRMTALERSLDELTATDRRQLRQALERLAASMVATAEDLEHFCRRCDVASCGGTDCPVACRVRASYERQPD